MMKFSSESNEAIVGLDIGSRDIKVVSMIKESGENVLAAYNIKSIPRDKKSKKPQLVQEILEEIDLHPERVNLSISGNDVIVRFINLPRMNKDQLVNALEFEAEKYIPFNVNEVVLDSIILGDASDPGQMRVLLAAAKRDMVEALIKSLEDIGITINLLDVDPFAAFNAFNECNPVLAEDEDTGSAFLHIGHSRTSVLVAVKDNPYFVRQIHTGGKTITKAIVKELSVSGEKAEEYRLGKGVEEDKAEAVKQVIESVLDDIIKEIQLSFGYFENRDSRTITNIYISGGLVQQPGIVEHLSKKLGIQVEKWSPIKGLKIAETLSREDIDLVASQLAVSIGLALRSD